MFGPLVVTLLMLSRPLPPVPVTDQDAGGRDVISRDAVGQDAQGAAGGRQDATASPSSTGDSDAPVAGTADVAGAEPPDTRARVSATPADAPVKAGDHMFGVLPNFGTVEGQGLLPPMTARQKIGMSARTAFDPFIFPLVGIVASTHHEFGGGVKGFAKQYPASFADNTAGNFLTGAIFPALLHQDPRYYGHGGEHPLKRAGYAATRVFITRGDSGRHQFNVSEFAGTAIAAGISNAYYPRAERTLGDSLSRWGMQMFWDSLTNQLKEFWPDVQRRLARHPHAP